MVYNEACVLILYAFDRRRNMLQGLELDKSQDTKKKKMQLKHIAGTPNNKQEKIGQ